MKIQRVMALLKSCATEDKSCHEAASGLGALSREELCELVNEIPDAQLHERSLGEMTQLLVSELESRAHARRTPDIAEQLGRLLGSSEVTVSRRARKALIGMQEMALPVVRKMLHQPYSASREMALWVAQDLGSRAVGVVCDVLGVLDLGSEGDESVIVTGIVMNVLADPNGDVAMWGCLAVLAQGGLNRAFAELALSGSVYSARVEASVAKMFESADVSARLRILDALDQRVLAGTEWARFVGEVAVHDQDAAVRKRALAVQEKLER